MVRLVTPGAVLALTVLAASAAGAAQPPDERAAARAFADAGVQLAAFFDGAEPQFDETVDMPVSRCARRQLRRMPGDRVFAGYELAAARLEGILARLVEQPLLTFSLQLHGVQTADPALRGGRAAWRRLRHAFLALAPFADVDVCAELRRYVASGFRRTPTMRRARRAFRVYNDALDGLGERVDRAIERMRELGVPRAQAEAFDGETDDDRAPLRA